MNTTQITEPENHVFAENPTHKTWLILRTFNNQERKSAQNMLAHLQNYQLQDKLVETFTPREQVIEINKDEDVKKERNFFPGTVFVAFDIESDHEIHDVAHLFVKNHQVFAKVKQEEIDSIKSLVAEYEEKPTTSLSITKGDGVTVTAGAYEGMHGKVHAIDLDNKKVTLNLSIFDRDVEITLDLTDVRKE